MPTNGGSAPQPERAGGGNWRLQRIVDSLNKARGDGYDTTPTSVVYAENEALGRAIDGMWSVAARMANQFDPLRTTTLLSRWERILGVVPLPTDSDATRRARLATARARFGRLASISYMTSLLQANLGPVFVAIETIAPSIANASWPGGTVSPYSPWYSTVAHMLVRTVVPPGWTEGMYQSAIAQVHSLLDGLLPAWVTLDVYRPSIAHTSTNVANGPSAAGFWLDDPLNLDNCVFDV